MLVTCCMCAHAVWCGFLKALLQELLQCFHWRWVHRACCPLLVCWVHAGGVAQVEHVFQSFVRAQPQQDPQDTAGGAYLHYDSSADEAAPPGTGAGGAEGMGVGGRGGKAARGRGGRGGGGRGRGGSKAGGGRAAGGVRKRGGGGARGHGGNKAAAGRQPQAAAAAQVAGGVSKAGGRGVQGSDSDDDYQPSK
jgi:hypothetical protein